MWEVKVWCWKRGDAGRGEQEEGLEMRGVSTKLGVRMRMMDSQVEQGTVLEGLLAEVKEGKWVDFGVD